MRHPAAVLPQVLADGERHIHPVHPYDGQRVAGDEVAELVEDAVVGQVVLGEGQRDPAPVQHGGGVLRGARGAAVLRGGLGAAVEIADDHRQAAQPLLGQPRGQRPQRGAAGLHEGVAQCEVLDGVAGQRHLGERDEVRALVEAACQVQCRIVSAFRARSPTQESI